MWISVKERIPSEKKKYLVYDKYGEINIALLKSFKNAYDPSIPETYFFMYGNSYAEGITHWMQLPSKPHNEKCGDSWTIACPNQKKSNSMDSCAVDHFEEFICDECNSAFMWKVNEI